MQVDRAHSQRQFDIRFDWGLAGADAIVAGADIAVVVDVLSFTTTLSVAIEAGTTVIPCRWRDHRAEQLARDNDAVLAVGRSVAAEGDISLSPTSLRSAVPPARLVLPSPNGSTIAQHLSGEADTCLGASLRNAGSVARWIRVERPGKVVAVVAAGEQWPDGTLRPAVEDLWGAGAVIAALVDSGVEGASPEALVAATSWRGVRDHLAAELRRCASGQELIDGGYPGDVDIAAEVDASSSVPILRDGHFVDAGTGAWPGAWM